jgi:hypothetical protein
MRCVRALEHGLHQCDVAESARHDLPDLAPGTLIECSTRALAIRAELSRRRSREGLEHAAARGVVVRVRRRSEHGERRIAAARDAVERRLRRAPLGGTAFGIAGGTGDVVEQSDHAMPVVVAPHLHDGVVRRELREQHPCIGADVEARERERGFVQHTFTRGRCARRIVECIARERDETGYVAVCDHLLDVCHQRGCRGVVRCLVGDAGLEGRRALRAGRTRASRSPAPRAWRRSSSTSGVPQSSSIRRCARCLFVHATVTGVPGA